MFQLSRASLIGDDAGRLLRRPSVRSRALIPADRATAAYLRVGPQ